MFGSAFMVVQEVEKQRKSYTYNLDVTIEVKLEFNEAVLVCKKR